ncbi:MAG: hypothetical protein IPM25_19830 [Chloracidobacterium sp.]|nr:hypothetical protein [Chloracidobacterium sp.]
MSSTISVGVHGASYWSYMADVMARALRIAAENRRFEAKSIPLGVFDDSKEFFELVLGATGDNKVPSNPPASINAFVMASDAVRGFTLKSRLPRNELHQLLRRFARFNKTLVKTREFDEKDTQTACELAKFFYQIALTGDEEEYVSAVGIDPVSFGMIPR